MTNTPLIPEHDLQLAREFAICLRLVNVLAHVRTRRTVNSVNLRLGRDHLSDGGLIL